MRHADDRTHSASRLSGRRHLLRAGGLGYLGLTLSGLLRAEESRSPAGRRKAGARSCILLYYYGGPSQLDTWDLKPEAPAEVRGEFRSIATRVPGVRVCEHLPQCARVMDRLALVRSLHHPMRNHNSAAVEMLCGRTPLKGDLELLADDPNCFPCYGAVVSRLTPGRRDVPTHVALPHVMFNVVRLPGQTPGFLGAPYSALQVNRDPNAPGFSADGLELPADLPFARL